jgi:hypothetical protein
MAKATWGFRGMGKPLQLALHYNPTDHTQITSW